MDPANPVALRKGLAVVPDPVVLPGATGVGLLGVQLSQDLSQDPHGELGSPLPNKGEKKTWHWEDIWE